MSTYGRSRLRGRRKWRALLPLVPLLLFFLATVGLGIVNAGLQGFGLTGPAASRGATDGALAALRAHPDLWRTVFHTLYVGAASAALSVALGAVFAYVLWLAPPPVRAVAAVYRIPIILPHLVVAFLTFLVWSRTGLVPLLLAHLGIIQEAANFPRLLYAPHGLGVILAYVYKEFPFVVLMALGVLDTIPRRTVVTARMLGAGHPRIFGRVVLPQIAPILNQMFVILFLYALGGFEIPYLLGASAPQMLPVFVYANYFHGTLQDRATALAVLFLLALFASLFVGLYTVSAERLARRNGGVQ